MLNPSNLIIACYLTEVIDAKNKHDLIVFNRITSFINSTCTVQKLATYDKENSEWESFPCDDTLTLEDFSFESRLQLAGQH